MKITLLLPLAVTSREKVSDLDRFLLLGLPSLHKFFPLDLVEELLIIVPSSSFRKVKRAVGSRCQFPCRVLRDEDIVPSPFFKSLSGWYRQQIIKLAAASAEISTEWYMTLDADVICTRSVDLNFLFPAGKAIWNQESLSDHPDWWEASINLLNVKTRLQGEDLVFGVTPALMHVPSVQGLHARLNRLQPGKDWIDVLAEAHCSWTEYTLYWLHLLENGTEKDLYSNNRRHLYGKSFWVSSDFDGIQFKNIEEIFDPEGEFCFYVIQSRLGIPLNRLLRLFGPFVSGKKRIPLVINLFALIREGRYGLYQAVKRVVRPLVRAEQIIPAEQPGD